MLGSYNLSASEIKSRILATVDFDEQLVDRTSSAGSLNIENALSIKDDILVIKNDSGNAVRLYGELSPNQSWICNQNSGPESVYAPYAPHTVGRVVPNYPAHGAIVARVWERPPGSLGKLIEPVDCGSLSGEVVFRQKSADSSSPFVSYPWSKVVSVIPKLPPIR